MALLCGLLRVCAILLAGLAGHGCEPVPVLVPQPNMTKRVIARGDRLCFPVGKQGGAKRRHAYH